MAHHIATTRSNVLVFVALLALLVATMGAAYLPLGRLHLPVALAIATLKAVLIVQYFMHVRFGDRLITITSVAALVWLAILMALTLGDYLSRGWLDILGK